MVSLRRLLILLVVIAVIAFSFASCANNDSGDDNVNAGDNSNSGNTGDNNGEPGDNNGEPGDNTGDNNGDNTGDNKNCDAGHTFVDGVCSVCGEKEPEADKNCDAGHTFVDGVCTVCGEKDEPDEPEFIDYSTQVKFDPNSGRLYAEVAVKSYIDGDTTHFVPIDGTDIGGVEYIKARYLAINTPESTGVVEPWGKKASSYTKTQLQKAVSIIVESDTDIWNPDSTGDRYLLWVWYKTAEDTEYRNLNLEILTQGLAFGSNVSSNSYGSVALAALNQAKAMKLYVFDKATKDPDYYYGGALELTLKELKANYEKYKDKLVKFDATVAKQMGPTIYVEEYDAENDMYFGMQIYAGYNFPRMEIFETIGNRVTIVGTLQYYENGGTYQISNLKYKTIDPNWEGGCRLIGTGYSAAYSDLSISDLMNGKITLDTVTEFETESGDVYEIIVKKEFSYGELAHYSTVTVHNLKVKSVYTTTSTTDSNGALTITCVTEDGITIDVRTAEQLTKTVDGEKVAVTSADFPAGTVITVKGIVDYFEGAYQIKVFNMNDVTYE